MEIVENYRKPSDTKGLRFHNHCGKLPKFSTDINIKKVFHKKFSTFHIELWKKRSVLVRKCHGVMQGQGTPCMDFDVTFLHMKGAVSPFTWFLTL